LITFINNWILILILSNIILFLIFNKLLISKKKDRFDIIKFFENSKLYSKYIIIILFVVFVHLIEVNFIDQIITNWIAQDFAYIIQKIEGNIIYNFSNLWQSSFIYYFVIMYIIVYPFTLWYSLYFFILTKNKKSLITLSYGLLLIYIISLPFYLFFPITNVYKFYNLESTLNHVIPNIESFFYLTTTQNNCFPSLHVAMSILLTRAGILTNNKKYSYFLIFSMISVIISVIYLTIHWLIDVIFGIILSLLVIFIIDKIISDD
jgi:hypothetical protein